MGVSSNEKNDLATYQIKDMAKTWCTQWMDNRALTAGPGSLEIFRRALIDRFFPKEKREAKMDEFINLRE